MHLVRILCGADVARGFSLAGLATVEVSGVEDGVERLQSLSADPLIGVILVEERIERGIPEEIRRAIGSRPLPMIVSFPGPTWAEATSAAESYIVDMLRLAIGYRVRL